MQGPVQGNVVFKPEKVSIESAFSIGWAHTKRQFVPLLVVMAVSWAIPAAFFFVTFILGLFIPKDQAAIKLVYGFTTGVLSLVVNAILELGMINVQLRVLDGDDARVADLFSASKLMFTYVLGNFCFNFMLFWGYLLFIVPGIFVSTCVQFYSYFIVDKEIGPIEAIRASWIASRGARLNIFLMVVLFHVLRSVGMMMFFIGLIPVSMVISLATTELYRQLVKNTAPDDFAGIEGLNYSLPTQEEFELSHRLVKPLPTSMYSSSPAPVAEPEFVSTTTESASSLDSDRGLDTGLGQNSELGSAPGSAPDSASHSAPKDDQQPGAIQ
ncbi:MAG: hypothetical protein WCT03_11160 [Candidatus Obscuribacterales bacterium]